MSEAIPEVEDGRIDKSILKKNRVMLVRDLDIEPILAGMREGLPYSWVDKIESQPSRVSKTGELLDCVSRSTTESTTANLSTFLKIVGGTQPDLFRKLVGREPTETEGNFCVKKYLESLKTVTKDQGHSIDSLLDERIEFESQHVELPIVRDDPDSSKQDAEDNVGAAAAEGMQRPDSGKQSCKQNVPPEKMLSADDNGERPKCVLLKGRSGTGKSTTCQWLARQWSLNKCASEFTLFFLLQIRMLSLFGCQTTAIELLTLHSLYHVQQCDLVCLASSWLKHSGEKLIIVMDGLDEISRFSSRFDSCRKITNLNEKAHPIDICINILRGNLFPGSTVLSASRSFAGLSRVRFDEQFEILDLSESRVNEFIERKHPNDAERIISVLKTSPLLMSICGITFYCVLISRLLAFGVEFEHEHLQTYTRLTAFILVQYVSRRLAVAWPFVIKVSSFFPKLARLAYSGIYEAQLKDGETRLVFDEYDLSRAKLTPDRLDAVCEAGLLHTKEVTVSSRSSVRAIFIHTSLQEMLASTYFLSHPPESENIFSTLFSGGQFNMAMLYLFGVHNDTASSWVRDIRHSVDPSGQGLSSAVVKQMDAFIDKLCEQCRKDCCRSQLQVCQLLYEGQMEDKAKGVVSSIIHDGKLAMRNIQMTLIDLKAVWFVCQNAETITEVSLRNCRLTDTLIHFMTSSFGEDHFRGLSVLDLKDNEIGDTGAKSISMWLTQTNRLETLDLSWNNIGDNGATDLASALPKAKSLESLDVKFNNNIGNTGLKKLKGAKLQNLMVSS